MLECDIPVFQFPHLHTLEISNDDTTIVAPRLQYYISFNSNRDWGVSSCRRQKKVRYPIVVSNFCNPFLTS